MRLIFNAKLNNKFPEPAWDLCPSSVTGPTKISTMRKEKSLLPCVPARAIRLWVICASIYGASFWSKMRYVTGIIGRLPLLSGNGRFRSIRRAWHIKERERDREREGEGSADAQAVYERFIHFSTCVEIAKMACGAQRSGWLRGGLGKLLLTW